ncbi:hypothetical protein [Nostoc sp.]|uniref:hypothetical protein n=1 Tax=Nostoc sp. TaxID=1180 RepID=UPI002FF98E4C
MSSQSVINPQILQQLQDEIQQKLGESLQNADLHSVLEKYGLLKDRVLRIHLQCNLDPNQLKSDDAVDEQQPNTLLPVTPRVPIPEIVLLKKALCIPCPSNGSPLGCNC